MQSVTYQFGEAIMVLIDLRLAHDDLKCLIFVAGNDSKYNQLPVMVTICEFRVSTFNTIHADDDIAAPQRR